MWEDESFNRTFMELKDVIVGDIDYGKEFQSHLYGIERYDRPDLARPHTAFQSHLYGIES